MIWVHVWGNAVRFCLNQEDFQWIDDNSDYLRRMQSNNYQKLLGLLLILMKESLIVWISSYMDSKILDVKKTMLQGDVTTEKIWRALFPIKMRQGPKARCVLYPFLLESLQFGEGLYFESCWIAFLFRKFF